MRKDDKDHDFFSHKFPTTSQVIQKTLYNHIFVFQLECMFGIRVGH